MNSKQTEKPISRNTIFELNKQLEAIFESSSDGLWVCDGQGRVIKINEASAKLNGVRASEVIGKTSLQMIREGVIDRSAVMEVLATKRKVSIMQYLPKTKKYVLVTGTPAFDENGDIFLVVLNEQDLTRLNIMGKQLEQARMVTEGYKDELLKARINEFKEAVFIAKDKKMEQVLETALKLARLDTSNILLLGESGTGKGLLAKFVHENSKRNKNQFIQINCAAVPETLLEAELFGYEKGAFTGASEQGKIGLFELAHKGTLFLDEIGDMPVAVQAKLLKYLDDHEILRLGGTKSKKIDCKILAATNKNLTGLVKNRRFREDLYYRLNAFTIHIPPLRERPEDIMELVSHFLQKYNKRYNARKKLTSKGLDALISYAFPGNVRELSNLMKKAVVFCDQDSLDDFFPHTLRQAPSAYDPGTPEEPGNGIDFRNRLAMLEKEMLSSAMMKCKSTRALAKYLGVSQPTIVRMMKKHSLSFDSIHN